MSVITINPYRFGGGGGAPGLVLWLKADAGVYTDAGSTLATDTQTVQQWNDQSGNGNHYTQATSGQRPVYRTNQYNGLPVIRLDGSDDGMGGLVVAAPYTIYVAYVPAASDTTGANRLLDGSNNWLIGPYNGGHWHYANGWVSQVAGGVSAGTPVICSATNDGTVSRFEVDGVDKTQDPNPDGAPGTLYIGGTLGAFSEPSGADVGEILVYTGAHGTTDRNDTTTYLLNRWGP